ncbi:Manganese transport system membrane protein MntB [Paracoccus haematequi]|uniref:Manganese transport system membrane protein MntB n=1 Tax=Paracoccus haematequi TaxID=2491866 RepID=A0A3S4ESH7_9RHOB|nr:metal ABC transporter permease [Paracoccus haematequi]VDS09140.1 Manganese transport system membrane protein MntB [Paracoccus haematequi]
MTWLTAPFAFPFMVDALLIAVIVAIPASLLSCFLVLRGWALMGDGISHAVLPGIVIAYLAGIPLLIGAFVAGMICALAAGWLDANSRVKPDTTLGVVMSGMFGLGIVIYTQFPTDVHLDHILFGNILGVGREDFISAGSISAVVALVLVLKWRDFALLVFDPVQARVAGLPVAWLHYGMLAMISAVVVAMLSAVGIILSVSLLIAPGAIAFLLTRRLQAMLALSVLIGTGSSLLGIWISFWLDSAPAPTIVVVMTALFTLVFAWRQLTARRAVTG